MKIIVLDEKPNGGGVFRKLVDLCESERVKPESLEWFFNPSCLISSFMPGENSLVFIRLGGTANGLTVARQLKWIDENVKLIFFSSNGNYALDSYEFQPVDYLVEPVDAGRLETVLTRAG